MTADMTLLALILIFGYIYFYINSKRYLVRENFSGNATVREHFEVPAPLNVAYSGKRTNFTVSWPGGVVSPPGYGQ